MKGAFIEGSRLFKDFIQNKSCRALSVGPGYINNKRLKNMQNDALFTNIRELMCYKCITLLNGRECVAIDTHNCYFSQ